MSMATTTTNIGKARDYLALTKPRVTWLILVTAAVGYFFGTKAGPWASVTIFRFLHTLVGTALMASATAVLNEWYERESDGKMRRTAGRPLPASRIDPTRALWFGIALAVVGSAELAWGTNVVAMEIADFTVVLYLFVYTPLKRRSWLSTTAAAFAGAMPPLIGYAAASGSLNAEAWALAAILFVWQFPHSLAIAWMYRDDYARAGIRMLPVVEPDGKSTARHIVAFASTLIPVSLFPVALGMTGRIYLVGALVLGGCFLYCGFRVAIERTTIRARQVLLASVVYLPLIMGLLMFDRPGI
jgi:protoheme IX farnesyltransferase